MPSGLVDNHHGVGTGVDGLADLSYAQKLVTL